MYPNTRIVVTNALYLEFFTVKISSLKPLLVL